MMSYDLAAARSPIPSVFNPLIKPVCHAFVSSQTKQSYKFYLDDLDFLDELGAAVFIKRLGGLILHPAIHRIADADIVLIAHHKTSANVELVHEKQLVLNVLQLEVRPWWELAEMIEGVLQMKREGCLSALGTLWMSQLTTVDEDVKTGHALSVLTRSFDRSRNSLKVTRPLLRIDGLGLSFYLKDLSVLQDYGARAVIEAYGGTVVSSEGATWADADILVISDLEHLEELTTSEEKIGIVIDLADLELVHSSQSSSIGWEAGQREDIASRRASRAEAQFIKKLVSVDNVHKSFAPENGTVSKSRSMMNMAVIRSNKTKGANEPAISDVVHPVLPVKTAKRSRSERTQLSTASSSSTLVGTDEEDVFFLLPQKKPRRKRIASANTSASATAPSSKAKCKENQYSRRLATLNDPAAIFDADHSEAMFALYGAFRNICNGAKTYWQRVGHLECTEDSQHRFLVG